MSAARPIGVVRLLRRGLAALLALLVWGTGLCAALAMAAALALWWWSDHPQSLALTLHWAAQALHDPEQGDGPLSASGVQGSLREGGTVEHLRWHSQGLDVRIDGLTLRWPAHTWFTALTERRLQLDTLSIQRLQVIDTAEDDTPWLPPTDGLLPWWRQIDIPFSVQQLALGPDPATVVGPLQARYGYGTPAEAPEPARQGEPPALEHHVQVDELRVLGGRYQGSGTWLAQGPLSLNATLTGQLSSPVPGTAGRVPLAVHAELSGDLQGPHAALSLKARAEPENTTTARAPRLAAELTVQPWSELSLVSGQLALSHLDLATFWPGLPHTLLDGAWQAQPQDPTPAPQGGAGTAVLHHTWQLQGRLSNGLPGPWNQGKLPLTTLQADLRLGPTLWTLNRLQADIAGGTLDATGAASIHNGQPTAWRGQARLRGLSPAQLLHSLPLPTLDAELQADTAASTAAPHPGGTATRFELNVRSHATAVPSAAGPAPALHAQGTWSRSRLQLSTLALNLFGAQLQAEGVWHAAQPQRLEGWANVDIPGATLALKGVWPPPATPRTGPAPASATSGTLDLALHDLAATQGWALRVGHLLQAMTPGADTTADPARPPPWHGRGTLRAHWQVPTHATERATVWLDTLALQARNDQQPLGWDIALAAPVQGQWHSSGGWAADAGTLRLAPLPAGAGPLPADMAQTPVQLQWDHLRWDRGHLSSRGRLHGLALSWLNAWLSSPSAPQGPLRQAGLRGDVLMNGEWDLALPLSAPAMATPQTQAHLTLKRTEGDLTLVQDTRPGAAQVSAGLKDVSLGVQLTQQQLRADARWSSTQAGEIEAHVETTLQGPAAHAPGWAWPQNAPLSGRLRANLPQLSLWSRWAPPGWRLSGRLSAQAELSGTRAQPAWDGHLQAHQLALKSLPDGLDFSDGTLQARLSHDTLIIDSLQLRGAGGTDGGLLSGSGSVRWAPVPGQTDNADTPAIDLQLQAQQLRLLARADRRLTLSGEMNAHWRGQRLDLTGQLAADQALFLLPDETTPALGRDVVVRGTERPPGFGAGAKVQTHVQVGLRLGERFQVRGLGLDTLLTGQLQFTANPALGAPQLTGQVQTERGIYRAYGQALGIEQGIIRFNGPVDNPGLDILALRPHPSQRVGVHIGGSAQAPRVRLYADPEMPDSDKLAWLVLGRPASGGGAETVILQQAALALISGTGSANDKTLVQSLGLDELSFQGETTQADGSTKAAALTLGKRISNRLYLSYSHSVVGALGTVAILYDVSRRLTLRAQAGDDNAVDLLWSHSFDGSGARTTPATPAPP